FDNRIFKTQYVQDTEFINSVIFRGGAESLASYQRKGNLIGVTGRLQSRTYENKQGQTVFVTEVVADSVQFLESKSNTNSQGGNQNSHRPSQNDSQGNPFGDNAEPIDI